MGITDISLTSGMRNNLVVLQGTAEGLNRTQARLSSGKKVSSALDNPTSFFAAQSLTSQASDLAAFKDGMVQGVQAIRAADVGIKAIGALLESMQAVLAKALATQDQSEREALLPALTALRQQITDIAHDSGYQGTNLLRNDDLTLNFNESSYLTVAGFDSTAGGLGILDISAGLGAITPAGSGAAVMADLNDTTYTGPDVTAVNAITVSYNVGAGVSLSTLQDTLSIRIGLTLTSSPKLAISSLTLSGGIATVTGALPHDVTTNDVMFFDWGAPSGYTIPTNPYNERTFATGAAAGSITKVLVGGVEQIGNYTIGSNGDIVFDPGSAPASGSTVGYEQGAGITDAAITAAADSVKAAVSILRAESMALSTDLSTVATRIEFNTAMVNVFAQGADKLTLADMNEEGANMLMLQTRQSLGIATLSLSAQAAQSVLKLF